MRMTMKLACLPILMISLSGCVNHDYQGDRLLGAATEQNIQLLSVRDADRPNHQEIDGGQGSTGANAVAALRGGQLKPAGSPDQ